MLKSNLSKAILGLGIIGAGVLIYAVVQVTGSTRAIQLNYDELRSKISNKQVKRATITETQVTGELADGRSFKTDVSNLAIQAYIAEELQSSGADVSFGVNGNSGLAERLVTRGWAAGLLLVAFVLLPVFWVWMVVDCAVNEPPGPDKIVWILIILLGNAIGAAIYFLVRKGKRGDGPLPVSS